MVRIKQVTTRRELRQFVHFPNELYKGDRYYVPQVESMDMATLSPKKNAAFEVCEGVYWLALDESGKVVGRVAAIINHRYNSKVGKKICRFGWIDFMDSKEVVDALMFSVERYARQKEMTMVEGPVGFLEFDISGILVEGFDRLPTVYGKYNHPYYEPLLLSCGYTKGAEFVEYLIDVPEDTSALERAAGIVALKCGLSEGHYRSKKELVTRYADGLFRVMNQAYSRLHGFSELSERQCADLKRQFLPHISLDYVSVVVDGNDEVVGFGVAMPSLSKAMQRAGGRLFPTGWMHVLAALRTNDTVDALLIAVRDDYRGMGVNAMILAKIASGLHRNGIFHVESTRELADNHDVQNMWGRFSHSLSKRARVYTKEIT